MCSSDLEFNRGRWSFQIEKAETVSYSPKQRNRLESLSGASAEVLAGEDMAYGKLLGELARKFLSGKKYRADFVASHGHTIFHQPGKGFTAQLGSGSSLSVACGLPVVCDFRSVDVALGGQGAPLVPIGDKLLFNNYSHCLNLGGIANISFDSGGKRIAFDICPVNMVLNALANQLGQHYDRGGKLAASGEVRKNLLRKLNALPFYRRGFPKSLGREDIERNIFPILERDAETLEDKLCTFCEHIAVQVARVSVSQTNRPSRMLVTGGGAYNAFLMERIRAHSQIKVVIPDRQVIEFKEAMIFAFLGVLRWRNEINSLSSVTGATRNSSGGAVYHP